MSNYVYNPCVCCGREMPEGQMVCRGCEAASHEESTPAGQDRHGIIFKIRAGKHKKQLFERREEAQCTR